MDADRSSSLQKPWNPEATLLDYIDQALQIYGNNPAYSQEGQTLSYREMIVKSRAIAAYLQQHPGLKPGDRIAVQLPNTLLYPVIAWGVLQAGMIIVNVNPQYTARETLKQLQDADVRAWFCADVSAHLLEEVRPELNCPLVVVCRLFDLHPWPQRNLFQFVIRYKRKAIKPYARHQVISFRKLLRDAARKVWKRPEPRPHDIAMLQYTGGSTGVLKGAMLSHSNLIANLEQVSQFLEQSSFIRGQEVVIAPLPIYHIFCFTVHCASSLITGMHNILILDATQFSSLIRELSRWPFACITGVNTLFHGLMRFESFRKLPFHHLKYAIAGGMKLEPQVARLWEEVTGKPVLEGFGMTELSPVASWNPPLANRIGTIGKPMPWTEFRIVDDDGRTLAAPEAIGELQVRGPQVMVGYWHKPEETIQHLSPDGWMRTGDLASFDIDGYWKIVGRKKRMILVSGFNVYPQEIEGVLLQHPDVVACQVFGVHHPINGEAIKVQIVSRNKELKAQDIRDYCKKNLTSYKIPRQIEFHESLPPLPA